MNFEPSANKLRANEEVDDNSINSRGWVLAMATARRRFIHFNSQQEHAVPANNSSRRGTLSQRGVASERGGLFASSLWYLYRLRLNRASNLEES